MSFKAQSQRPKYQRKEINLFQQLNKSWTTQNDQNMHSMMIWNNYSNGNEGEQNIPSLNMPPWHVDYFQLKVTKTQQTREKLLPLP